MRRPKAGSGRGKQGGKSEPPAPQGPVERARSLLLRLETGGHKPVNAAEELDRLQARLERDEKLEPLVEEIRSLCDAWSETPLRGERGHAWLTLVGGFGLDEHLERVTEILLDAGQAGPLRVHACRVLPQLDRAAAAEPLQDVLLNTRDAQVRAAAAEALGELGDREARPVLEALLDEDLPRPVWEAVSAALDRLQ
jgi:HEAT repeat protein